MSLRLRLALALLLLSALPLAGLALFSYSSSSRALRSAAEQEAAGLARDLAQRVGTAAEGAVLGTATGAATLRGGSAGRRGIRPGNPGIGSIHPC